MSDCLDVETESVARSTPTGEVAAECCHGVFGTKIAAFKGRCALSVLQEEYWLRGMVYWLVAKIIRLSLKKE